MNEYEPDPYVGKDVHQVMVAIETKDSGSYGETIRNPTARHDDPLSDDGLGEKFMECATPTIDRYASEQALERLGTPRGQNDTVAVTRLFQA